MTEQQDNALPAKAPWKVSLHGGHSGLYSGHARGTLRETLDAAVAYGYGTFGVTEHAPRLGDHLLHDEEKALGWTVETLMAVFEAYAREVAELAEVFSDRLTVLRGFEVEVAPADRYTEIMLEFREKHRFEYIVGSVHFLDDVLIDGPPEGFARAVERCGGLEALVIRYYEMVREMVAALRPEIVGHLDLVRRNAPSEEAVATPAIQATARETLKVIRSHGCILDLNTAGYRKGLSGPYPAPWLLKMAHEMGIGFCFGDDSHGPEQVGAGIEEARRYLLEHGIGTVTILVREAGSLVKKVVDL